MMGTVELPEQYHLKPSWVVIGRRSLGTYIWYMGMGVKLSDGMVVFRKSERCFQSEYIIIATNFLIFHILL
jgi:hypothetical protein